MSIELSLSLHFLILNSSNRNEAKLNVFSSVDCGDPEKDRFGIAGVRWDVISPSRMYGTAFSTD